MEKVLTWYGLVSLKPGEPPWRFIASSSKGIREDRSMPLFETDDINGECIVLNPGEFRVVTGPMTGDEAVKWLYEDE